MSDDADDAHLSSLATIPAERPDPSQADLAGALRILHMLTNDPLRARLAFSPDEAAEVLGISRQLVDDLLRTGQLKSVKAGRRVLIGRRMLETFLGGGK